MKRVAASLLAMVLTVVPLSVRPLGMGEVELRSHLNEPLDAIIPLLSVAGLDPDAVRISLGSPEQFARAGIERPHILTTLRFESTLTGRRPHIAVTTRQPVAEPFLNFLVEIDWPNGRTLREYTLLLDPPVYGAAIQTQVERTVQASAPPPPPVGVNQAGVIQGGSVHSHDAGVPHSHDHGATIGHTHDTVTSGAPMSATHGHGGATYDPGGTYGPVNASDTLWSLADRFRGGSGVSIQQMMLAMLRLNPEAFDAGNVNRLREGAILNIPSSAEAEVLSRRAALAEVQRQHAAWQDFRSAAGLRPAMMTQARAAPAPASSEADQTVGSTGPTSTDAASAAATDATDGTTTGATAEATTGADGRLKLVSGGQAVGGEGTSGDGNAAVSALRSELDKVREDADASRREAEELAARVEETEAIIEEQQRLLKLRDADLAALQDKLRADGEAAMSAAAPAGQTTTASGSTTPQAQGADTSPASSTTEGTAAPTPAQPEVKAPVKPALPTPTKPSGGILDDIRRSLGDIVPFDPLLLIGGGILAVVIAVVGVVFSRRRKSEEDEVAQTDGSSETAPGADDLSFADTIATEDVPDELDGNDTVALDSEQLASATEPSHDSATADELADPVVPEEQTTQAQAAEEDPLAEVNVYLAYERFEQAENLVQEAIDKHPGRPEYKLKLLEIYHASKNVAAFSGAAAALQASVGDNHEMMDTARQWWRDLSPGTELFSEESTSDLTADAGADDDIFDVTAAPDGPQIPVDAAETTTQLSGGVDASGGVDFDLGLDFETAADTSTGQGSTDVDFDLGFDADAPVGSDTGLDLDLSTGEISDGGAEDDAGGGLGLGLAGAAAAATAAAATVAAVGEDTGIDFDLSGLVGDEDEAGEETETTADVGEGGAEEQGLVLAVDDSSHFEATDIGDTDLDFALDAGTETGLDIPTPTADADGLDLELPDPSGTDLGLDFELDVPDSAESSADAAKELAEQSGIDLDLGDFSDDAPDGTPSQAADSGLGLDLDAASFEQVETVALDVKSGTGAGTDIDLDLDTLADTSELTEYTEAASEPGGLDFELDVPGAEGSSDDAGGLLDLDFDSFGGSDESKEDELGTIEMAAREGEGDSLDMPTASATDDPGLDFDLDFPGADVGAQPSSDTDLDFDLTEVEQTAALNNLPDGEASELSIDEDFAGLFAGEGDSASSDPGDDGLDFDFDSLGDEPTEVPGDTGASTGTSTGTPAEDPNLDLDALLVADDSLGSTSSGAGEDTASNDDVTNLNLDELTLEVPEEAGDSVLDLDFGTFGDGADPSESGLDLDFEALEDGGLVEPIDDEHEPIDDERETRTLALGRGADGTVDEVQTKLDLANAYIEMGDSDGAKGMLAEVMAEGGEGQRAEAERLLKTLG